MHTSRSVPNTSKNRETRNQETVPLLPFALIMSSKVSNLPAESSPASDMDDTVKYCFISYAKSNASRSRSHLPPACGRSSCIVSSAG